MDDHISRQAAIDKVWNITKIVPTMAIRAKDALEAISSAQQWIPCKWHTEDETLPKECKSVLVCIDEISGYKIDVSYRSDYNRWEGYGRVNVVAWMPLPEPYTGEES